MSTQHVARRKAALVAALSGTGLISVLEWSGAGRSNASFVGTHAPLVLMSKSQ